MGKHRIRTKSPETLAGGVLLGAVASGLAAAALGGAGTATANCASISGISTGSAGGGSCSSGPLSFAVGIGPNTTANANGVFDGAVAYGLDNGVTDSTVANANNVNGGAFNFALASGKNALAQTNGAFGNLAIAQGTGVTSATPGGTSPNPVTANAGVNPGDVGNLAINIGGSAAGAKATTPNLTQAAGTLNSAINLGGSTAGRPMIVQAFGVGNSAFSGSGNGNIVSVGNLDQALVTTPPGGGTGIPAGKASTLGVAFNGLGQNNTVTALGPSIAGTLGVNDHNAATPPPAGAFSSVFAGPGTINIKTTANP